MATIVYRRRSVLKLRSLGLSQPGTVQELCDAVAADTGRAIQLVAMPLATTDPCSLWLGTPDTDFILLDPAVAEALRTHSLLHELGHIVFGHHDLTPAGQLRHGYAAGEECQAEVFADVVASMVRRTTPASTWMSPTGHERHPQGRQVSRSGSRLARVPRRHAGKRDT